MMEDKMTFTVTGDNGKEIECEVYSTFEIDETNKSYMIYTDNTTDNDGNIKLYAAIYNPDDAMPRLIPIENDDEWKMIEAVVDEFESLNNRGDEEE